MANYQLTIVTPEETIFEKTVESIVVPGAKGYLGVMANHAPLITPIRPGKLTIHMPPDTELLLAISGGFLEVAHNKATILADACEFADKIDRERALAALERAKERLKHPEPDLDLDRATAAFQRAKNRLNVMDSVL
ncbi:MAG: F0F1 ATP synthase subunit epsilon [Candidatus Zixiibacteriota bacterium]